MRRFSLYRVLMLPALATSLLVNACIADAMPTPFPTPMPLVTPTPQSSTRGEVIPMPDPPKIYLVYNLFVPGQRINTAAELTRFLPGEKIDVTLKASDGSQAPLGTATADDGGMASVDIRHDGLSEGKYAVTATGDGGSEADAALLVAVSNPALYINLIRNNFSADLPISTTAVLSGFEEGESIEVSLMSEDGSSTAIGSATANAGGFASVDIRHDGLSAGLYVVVARTEGGAQASTAFFVK